MSLQCPPLPLEMAGTNLFSFLLGNDGKWFPLTENVDKCQRSAKTSRLMEDILYLLIGYSLKPFTGTSVGLLSYCRTVKINSEIECNLKNVVKPSKIDLILVFLIID